MSEPIALRPIDVRALELLLEHGGSMLVTRIPDKTERELVFGTAFPGHAVYKRLEKLGLCFYSIEDPFDLPGDPLDGYSFTPEVYLTEEGRSWLDNQAAERREQNARPRCG